MPTPFELLVDPVSLCVIAVYAALISWEALAPARSLPPVAGWKLRGLASFVCYFFLSSYLPLLLAEQLSALKLFDLSHLGIWTGAALGLLAYEAAVYCWHRGMHNSDLLWRVFHQMHHSAERIDSYGAFWFSPWDMAGWTLLFSVTMSILGLPPQSVTAVLLAATLLSVFQHCNVRTPRWLGFIFQRPESHSCHHERGLHAGNYADLPIFDLLCGSFVNPRGFARENGFYDGASRRVLDMLRCRDVSRPVQTGQQRAEGMVRG